MAVAARWDWGLRRSSFEGWHIKGSPLADLPLSPARKALLEQVLDAAADAEKIGFSIRFPKSFDPDRTRDELARLDDHEALASTVLTVHPRRSPHRL